MNRFYHIRLTMFAAILAMTLLAAGNTPAQTQPAKIQQAAAFVMKEGPVDHIASPFPKPPPPSTHVRVVVLDSSPTLKRAGRVAVLLTRFRKRELEERIGMKIDLVNVSSISTKPVQGNVVTYRPGFMRAALLIAKAIPGEQSVGPLRAETMKKSGIDIEILLGEKAP